MQQAIEREMREALALVLEDTTGQDQFLRLRSDITYAEEQLALHEKGGYMYNLIEADLLTKREQLARFEEELGALDIENVTATYRQRILRFLDFLNTMRGNYQNATFQQKRNALEVLGVQVAVSLPAEPGEEDAEDEEEAAQWENGPGWFTGRQAAMRLGVVHRSIYRYIRSGQLNATMQEEPFPTYYIHRDDLRKLHLSAKEFNTAKMVRKRMEVTYHPLIFLPTGVALPSPRFRIFQYQAGHARRSARFR